MKGLCIKDIRLLLKQKTFFLVIVFLSIMNGMNVNNTAIVPSLMIFFLATLVFTTITYDEMDHGLTFLFTLPISRKKYVAGKYLLTIAIIAAALVVSLGMVLTINQMQQRTVNVELLVVSFGLVSVLGILYMSLMLPIYFKFGAEKSRLILILVMGTILLLGFAGNYLFGKTEIDVIRLINGVVARPAWQLATMCMALSVATAAISYLFSVGIMKKKEV